VLFELAGRRHLVNCSQTHAFGVDAETGKLLWTYPMPTPHKVLATAPAVYGGGVFVTGPDSPGGTLLRILDQKEKVAVEPAWISKLDTCQGGVVFMDDRLIGSWYRGRKGWACLSAKTGEVLYQNNDLAKGSVLFADGLFYALCEDGPMTLLRAAPDRFEIVSQFKFAARHKNDVWTHPVIHQGRLYLRYHERLACFDVRRAN
jgi:outer membrane protein assembly factor BamB